jgi:uncharacterized protein (TIGR01777 family)
MRIFITGGTGLVGHQLVRLLHGRDDEVVVLSRRPAWAQQQLGESTVIVEGDPTQNGPWMDAVGNCDAVVHLAGENVFAQRWNEAFKQKLFDSRIRSTHHVVEALRRVPMRKNGKPKVLVNASAIGYYGPRGDEELDENTPPGDDFLARLCVEWEKAARDVESAGVRVAMVRVGVVLDRAGGALAKLLTPFKLGVGGPVAGGNQWMSWIHHQDLLALFRLAIDNPQARGPINGTSPNPARNRDFSKALGKALGRPSFVPTPGFALRLMLGEGAQLVTTGQRVFPRRAQELEYAFQFPTLDGALADILGRPGV